MGSVDDILNGAVDYRWFKGVGRWLMKETRFTICRGNFTGRLSHLYARIESIF